MSSTNEEEFLKAARHGNLVKMKGLVKRIDINFRSRIKGDTALIIATRNEDFEMIRFLISNGAHIDKTDSYGWTPLHNASYRGSLVVVMCIVANGAKLDCRTPMGHYWAGLTPLSILETKYGPHHKIVEFLKQKLREQKEKYHLEEFLKDARQDTKFLCVICFTPRKGIFALSPCGHASMCEACCITITSQNGAKCPTCRRPVKEYLKIFFQASE